MDSQTNIENARRAILVADPDPTFLESLKVDGKKNILMPYGVEKRKDAQVALADEKNRFVALVLNPEIDHPSGISVIRFCKYYRPSLPIYVVYHGTPPFDEKEANALGIHSLLQKPVTYSALVDKVAPNLITFDQSLVVPSHPELNSAKNQTVEAADSRFIPIIAEDFFASSKSYFDVFIKLAPLKYLKILKSGEIFEAERLRGYLKKGVKHFYIDKTAQSHYLAYVDQLATMILSKDKNFSVEAKAQVTLNHGEETIKFLKAQGVSQGNIQFAESFVKNVHTFIDTLAQKQVEELPAFFKDFSKYDHGVSATMIAGLLAHQCGVDGIRGVQIVGLASLLHDIGLLKTSFQFNDEDESRLTPKELAEYHTHPLLSASVLRKIRGINPSTVQAVAQHHERRTRKGFPNHLGLGSINKVAEIVGMSDQFAGIIKAITKQALPLDQDLYSYLESNLFPGFSEQLCDHFRLIFFPDHFNTMTIVKSNEIEE